jgi:hypothetical protein
MVEVSHEDEAGRELAEELQLLAPVAVLEARADAAILEVTTEDETGEKAELDTSEEIVKLGLTTDE